MPVVATSSVVWLEHRSPAILSTASNAGGCRETQESSPCSVAARGARVRLQYSDYRHVPSVRRRLFQLGSLVLVLERLYLWLSCGAGRPYYGRWSGRISRNAPCWRHRLFSPVSADRQHSAITSNDREMGARRLRDRTDHKRLRRCRQAHGDRSRKAAAAAGEWNAILLRCCLRRQECVHDGRRHRHRPVTLGRFVAMRVRRDRVVTHRLSARPQDMRKPLIVLAGNRDRELALSSLLRLPCSRA